MLGTAILTTLVFLGCAKPVSLLNHTLVDHLEKGKHLFVLFSSGRFDQPDAAHHMRSGRPRAGKRSGEKHESTMKALHERKTWHELDAFYRDGQEKSGTGAVLSAHHGHIERGTEKELRVHRENLDEGKTWEELGAFYKDDAKVLIGYLNCQHSPEEQQMCKEHAVSKFPTLIHYKGDEWSTPGVHQHYEGQRDLESLKKFVEEFVRQPRFLQTEL